MNKVKYFLLSVVTAVVVGAPSLSYGIGFTKKSKEFETLGKEIHVADKSEKLKGRISRDVVADNLIHLLGGTGGSFAGYSSSDQMILLKTAFSNDLIPFDLEVTDGKIVMDKLLKLQELQLIGPLQVVRQLNKEAGVKTKATFFHEAFLVTAAMAYRFMELGLPEHSKVTLEASRRYLVLSANRAGAEYAFSKKSSSLVRNIFSSLVLLLERPTNLTEAQKLEWLDGLVPDLRQQSKNADSLKTILDMERKSHFFRVVKTSSIYGAVGYVFLPALAVALTAGAGDLNVVLEFILNEPFWASSVVASAMGYLRYIRNVRRNGNALNFIENLGMDLRATSAAASKCGDIFKVGGI